MPATERDVSMVFQSYALFPHMTVLENVAYGLRSAAGRKAEARARAEEGLALVGLEGFGRRLPSELSGGQQQRVAVARALVLEPEVLLFDEPLSNLDAKLRRRVREEIRELQQKLGLTVGLRHPRPGRGARGVGPDHRHAQRRDRPGRARPRELYEQPLDRFVADFIGDANLVEAEVAAVDGAARDRAHRPADPRPAAPRPRARPGPGGAPPGDHPPACPSARRTRSPARSRRPTYLGSHMEYTVSTPLGELFVVDPHVDRTLPPAPRSRSSPAPAASPWCVTRLRS